MKKYLKPLALAVSLAAFCFKSGLVFAETISTSPDSALANTVTFKDYLVPFINFLSAGVGVVIVAVIIIGGIQYSTSANNPQSVSAARNRILNALLALVAYALIYAFLNFIIPGGLITL
jgi:hypothetical protein